MDTYATNTRSSISIPTTAFDRASVFAAVETLMGIPVRDLVLQFESLGENCEFGLVQRVCGAEPLGLFRFAAIKVDKVAHALNTDFEGMADPAALLAVGTTSWYVHNPAYGMIYHTFLKCDDIPADEMLRRQSARLKFLANKLAEDFAEGEKTFVVWGRHDPLGEAAVQPLLDALHSRGPAWLLYVVPGEPSGVVEVLRPGLMRATIDRLSPMKVETFSLIGWLTILANAALLRRLCGEPPHSPAGAGCDAGC